MKSFLPLYINITLSELMEYTKTYNELKSLFTTENRKILISGSGFSSFKKN
jgi:hypothetical protein